MTCGEYCKSREGKEWLGQDTDYVLGHIREIEKLAQDCVRRSLGSHPPAPQAPLPATETCGRLEKAAKMAARILEGV